VQGAPLRVLTVTAYAFTVGGNMAKSLLDDIEAFLAETGMGSHRFGFLATHNSRLVERLRRGTSDVKRRPVGVWPETEIAVRTFMATERRARAAKARASELA
jgi:hypothetical protein